MRRVRLTFSVGWQGWKRSVRRSRLLNLVVVGLLLACAAPLRRQGQLKVSELEVERLVVVDSSGTPCAVFGPHERAAGRVAVIDTAPEHRPPDALRFYDDSGKEIATFPPR